MNLYFHNYNHFNIYHILFLSKFRIKYIYILLLGFYYPNYYKNGI